MRGRGWTMARLGANAELNAGGFDIKLRHNGVNNLLTGLESGI